MFNSIAEFLFMLFVAGCASLAAMYGFAGLIGGL